MHTKERLVSLGRLRGLAALCVVFGHAFNVKSLNAAQDALNPIFLIFASGTVIFVLIAGVLFRMKAVSRLISRETCTKEILRGRWSELSGTYLTVGLFMAILFSCAVGIQNGLNPFAHGIRMMLNGSMAHSYWYVPFFLLLMVLAPLHVLFSQLKLPTQIPLIIFGMLVSAFMHRPASDVTLGAVFAVVYYLPIFWFGLVLGSHWQAVLNWLHGKEALVGILFICVTALQVNIGQKQIYLHRFGENFGEVDLFIIQKLLLSIFFISVFHRTQFLQMPLLDWVSKHSLIIFFMHSPVLLLITSVPHLSGFYVPELVLVAAITVLGGVQLHKTLVRTFNRLPEGMKRFAVAIRDARPVDALPNRISAVTVK